MEFMDVEDTVESIRHKLLELLAVACETGDVTALDLIWNSPAHLQTLLEDEVKHPLQHQHNEAGFSVFHQIAIAGHMPLFQYMVDRLQVDLHIINEVSQCNVVMMICAHGHIDLLRFLHQRRTDNASETLKQLLEAQDKDGWTALIYAVTSEVLELVRFLVEELHVNLNHVDHIGWSALMYASQLDNDDIVDYLLTLGDVEANQQDFDDGWTALMHAIKSNKAKNVEKLISSEKCGMNVQSWNGTSPLMICVKESNMAMMELLMGGDKGVDLDLQDALGNTALIHAVLQDNLIMVEYILKQECNVNTANEEGNTALFYASMGGNYAMVNALLQCQADTRIKNFKHISVFDVTTHADIRTLLELHRVRERIRLSLSPQKYMD